MNSPQNSRSDHPIGDPLSADKKSYTKFYVIIGILSAIILLFLIYVLAMGGRESVIVESFAPQDEVPQTTNFTIAFSKDVADDSLLNVWLPKAPIHFNPPIRGKFQWIERNKIRFYPEAPLLPSTQYVAEISPRLVAQFGLSLKGTRQFRFYTQRFQVNSAALAFDFIPNNDKVANVKATVEFNYEVDPEAAGRHTTIQYRDGEVIPFKLMTTQPGRIIELVAERVMRSDKEKEIQLKISSGLIPIAGKLGLEQDFVRPILLPRQQELKVESALVRWDSPRSAYIQIQFNLPIHSESANQFILIEPAVRYQVSVPHTYLELRGDFKIGSSYQLKLRQGLRAIDGSQLQKDFSTTLVFRSEDIPPQLDFVGQGFYLTKSGNLNIGLATINVDRVTIEIDKIYANNLVYLLSQNDLASGYDYYWYDTEALGKSISRSDLVIQKVHNEEVVTPINIKEFLKEQRVGIFNITARLAERRWQQASRWVLATDLGIIAKKAGEDLWVWVNSLTSIAPIPNAEVKLISRNNQELITVRTNAQGYAVLNSYRRFESEGLPPFLLTVAVGEDFSFLELSRRQIATADFDVGGAAYLEHGYDAYLYNERGVYRPGETAHLAAIVRGENLSLPTPFPVLFQVKAPDEKILLEQRTSLNAQGGTEFSVPIPDYAMTGKYTARLMIGENEEIGRTEFNVEEFIPDRIKVSLATIRDIYRTGEIITLNVDAVTLFGPPAAGRRVEADIEIEPFSFSPDQWKSFSFQDDRKSFAKMRTDLGSGVLDDQGQYRFLYQIPTDLEPPAALRGIISATVLEPGGRGVTAYRGIIIHRYPTYVGLRQAQPGYAEPNKKTPIEFVVLNSDGQLLPGRTVEISFYRVVWHSILKKEDNSGRYRYVSQQVDELIEKFTVTSESSLSSFTVMPRDYGRYRVLAREVSSGATASLEFYASGWGYAPWAMDHPDRIQLDLDKECYLPGEKARVQVRAPFAGKLLLTVEREKILSTQVVNLPENTATIDIPVLENYKPNVYLSAHLIRSTESLDRDMPSRAFGVTPLMVDSRANRFELELRCPDEIRPNSKLSLDCEVKGQMSGPVYLTIAAVDEGILQLTDFQSPDAHAYFFSKKRLAVETHDVYGAILPEIKGAKSAPSGDVEAARKRRITPVSVTRVKPVAFWSGMLKADARGRKSVTFNVPQFNGTLRIMAVAFSNNKFGSLERKMFVREPIVLTPTFPRFVASGDRWVVPVSLYNGTGKTGDFEVTLNASGPIRITDQATKTITVEAGKERAVYFELQAEQSIGQLRFKLSAKGAGESTSLSEEVPLRPPVPFITRSGQGSVSEAKPGIFTLPSDWIAGTTDFSLSLSAFPAVRFANSLQFLLSYPHGCIEQTTSKVFPLLYFDELARIAEPALFKANSADYFITEGITKIENLQQPSGAFSYWPHGEDINNWSSIYAAHFLVEARKAGYVVSDRVYNRMLKALRSQLRDYQSDDAYSLQAPVYALYVLALSGNAERSTMLYFKNNLLEKLADYSRFQLAGAYALAGDLQTARSLLPRTVLLNRPQQWESGGNFNSNTRSQAIMLDILAEVEPSNPNVPNLVQNLTQSASEAGRWYTTQENAWAFLALGKILKKQTDVNFTGTVSIDGKFFTKFDTQNHHFADKNWAGKTIKIEIQGKGTCYYGWRAHGIPLGMNIEEFDHDLMVRRHYLNEQGTPADYSSFRQGELIIGKITLKALTESLENVAIVDMLPAGLEIENPRFQSRRGVDWIGEQTWQPKYIDIRDDRLILYGDVPYGREVTFYYGLRAVSEGTFILPPIQAEAMYAPMKASIASSGRIVIAKP
ncbi:MAG: MG2 domain-containing protein [candidate division KSB1 bacterium]|nr:MG2 domain-containing protein [candidate division KSB1 bacterium]